VDRGEGNEGGEDIGEVFVVLCEATIRPNQEKVRSATQRRVSTTKPFMSSDRLTILTRRLGTLVGLATRLFAQGHEQPLAHPFPHAFASEWSAALADVRPKETTRRASTASPRFILSTSRLTASFTMSTIGCSVPAM
jgi:hypothetical protein